MKKIKKFSKEMKKKIVTAMILMNVFIMQAMPVYADTAEPKLVSGTKNLLTDVGTYLTALIGGATVAIALWRGFQWQAAEDTEKTKYGKMVKNTLIIGIILTCLSGLVTWIFGYYK